MFCYRYDTAWYNQHYFLKNIATQMYILYDQFLSFGFLLSFDLPKILINILKNELFIRAARPGPSSKLIEL